MNMAHFLSVLVFSPLIGILVLTLIPKTKESVLKAVGFLATLPALVLSFTAFFQYKAKGAADAVKWQESADWIAFKSGADFTIKYELGADGLSLALIMLTALVATLAAIASIYIKKEWKGYFMLFLLLETGMLGVFAAENLILFFLFFELTLIPTFFLVGKWGYFEKEKAAYSFLIYNGLGSAILLIVIIVLFAKTGTANIAALADIISSNQPDDLAKLSESLRAGLLIALLIAFGIKLPIFPLHSWMVRMHVEAPPSIVMIHSGILLKIGAYGLIRIALGIFPQQFRDVAVLVAVLGVINLLYGAFLALIQTDFKKVLAYSSISHMGIVLIGLGAFNEAGIQGAIFQVVSHGLISALLFFLVSVFYERTHTTEIQKLGGMAKGMPITSGFLLAAGMASLGLPGMSGFVGEFMSFLGLFKAMPILAAVGALGIILTAVYILRSVLGITFGQAHRDWAGTGDLRPVEYVPAVVLTVFIVMIGVFPSIMSEPLQATLETIMHGIGG